MLNKLWKLLILLSFILLYKITIQDDKQKYMITVYTGDKIGAGTDARVFINIKGSKRSSGEIELSGGDKDIFERNEVDTFMLDIPNIGSIQKLYVRHDNSNFGASWYLEKIDITLEDGQHLEFPFDDWLDSNITTTLVSSYTRRSNQHPKKNISSSTSMQRRSNIIKETLQPLDCSKPLGMNNGLIKDNQISASTSLNDNYLPFHARLNRIVGDSYGGWCPFKDDKNQFIQIDLTSKTVITGITTQGLGLVDEWTTSYKVSYLSLKNISMFPSHLIDTYNKSFVFYQENFDIKDFISNTDQNTTITNWLDSYILTSIIRIYPVTVHAKGCLRIELYGCNADDFNDNHPEHISNDALVINNIQKKIESHNNTIKQNDSVSPSESPTPSIRNNNNRVVTNDTLLLNENSVVVFDFDEIKDNTILDVSGHSNDAIIHPPIDIVTLSVTCGKGIRLNGGSLFVDGEFFMDKPTIGITVAAWIKLFNNGGQHTIFNVIGAINNGHNKGVGYLLEVERGQLKWSHRQNNGNFIFNSSTGLKVPSHTWTHIAATYDVNKKEAHLFVNGKLSASSIGLGEELSQDWSGGLIIGSNHGSKFLNGEMDEFIMFKKALTPTKIEILMRRCDFETDCHLPIGMESKLIPDSAISASSSYNLHKPQYSRLNLIGEMNDPARTAWCADTSDTSPYIEIKLAELTTLTSIATQGLGLFDNWVTGYIVCFGDDSNKTLSCLKEKGLPKVWPANVDKSNVRHHSFRRPINAKIIQLKPVSWFGNHLCLRLELYGCKMDLYPDPFDTFNSLPSFIEETESNARDHIPGPNDDCNTPLGISNGEIDDLHLSASSELGEMHQARYGRLLHDFVSDGTADPNSNMTTHGCWCSKDVTIRQYLEVDLGEVRKITAIATQGYISKQNWVSTYRIGYGDDYGPVHWYTENGLEKIFAANNDSTSIVKNYLNIPINAKYVRINPRSWNGQHICMRLELFGCTDNKNLTIEDNSRNKNDVLNTFISKNEKNYTSPRSPQLYQNLTSTAKPTAPINNTSTNITLNNKTNMTKNYEDDLYIDQVGPPNSASNKPSAAINFKDASSNENENDETNAKPQNITYSREWDVILNKYPELIKHGVSKDLLETVYSAIPDIEDRIDNYFKDQYNNTPKISFPLMGVPEHQLMEEAAPPFSNTESTDPIYIIKDKPNNYLQPNEKLNEGYYYDNGSRKNVIGTFYGDEPLWFNEPLSTISYNQTYDTIMPNYVPAIPENESGTDDVAADWMDPNQNPWSSFTDCSQHCGIGVKMRQRRCDVPACPSPGTETQTIPCIKALCSGESESTTEWSPFTPCTSRCGVGKTSRFRICNGTNCPVPGYETQIAACWNPSCAVLKLDFETVENGGIIIDASGYGNHAKFVDGARIISHDNCGHFIDFGNDGKLLLPTITFRNKPLSAITISCWINLYNVTGKNSIFTTERTFDTSEFIGGYHFEIDSGSIRWFHRDNQSRVIFSAFTDPIITVENIWTHIAATYDMNTSTAKIFVDGSEILSIQSENIGQQLSTDWGEKAIIGDYEYDDRHFSGYMDDFTMYDYVINNNQLSELLSTQPTCNALDPEKWP